MYEKHTKLKITPLLIVALILLQDVAALYA